VSLLLLFKAAAFDDVRQSIITGLDSAQAEGTGWDAVVKAGLAVTTVVKDFRYSSNGHVVGVR